MYKVISVSGLYFVLQEMHPISQNYDLLKIFFSTVSLRGRERFNHGCRQLRQLVLNDEAYALVCGYI
jgi:hypothetical protein